jgi:hypothetical protein
MKCINPAYQHSAKTLTEASTGESWNCKAMRLARKIMIELNLILSSIFVFSTKWHQLNILQMHLIIYNLSKEIFN